ncbi:hypothetical protein [Hyphomicrobium sp. CS1GBMeth3]|uniref:hypothetical protein n=1 Tax=Hyphomicrobium sp. CS1GBMeth3 TaxID=1892845 RepID=UPI000A6094FE|nr:hypothetical protein [Hyphomicrobium sp. CS1GBMeth3]
MIWKNSARHAAVQGVMAASATLSASYYASQAPTIAVSIIGWTVNPVAVGLGATAFALDLLKPEMLRLAGTSGAGAARRIAAGAVFGVLFIASMVAVDGMLMKLRSEWSGARLSTMGEYDRAEAEYKSAEAELAKLKAVRSIADVKASMDAAPVPRNVFRRTDQCTDVTRDDSFAACKPILDLRQEMAQAIRKRELEGKRDAAKAKLDATQRPVAADPQAAALAKASGLDESIISYLLVAIIGFAVELVACIGLWLLTDKPRGQEEEDEAPATIPVTAERRALDWVLGEMAKSGGKLAIMNTAIAKRFDVDPGTVTRWRQRWIEDGKITEERLGRYIILGVAS